MAGPATDLSHFRRSLATLRTMAGTPRRARGYVRGWPSRTPNTTQDAPPVAVSRVGRCELSLARFISHSQKRSVSLIHRRPLLGTAGLEISSRSTGAYPKGGPYIRKIS